MIDISQVGAHALAYLGDSVLETMIREALIFKGIEKSSHLNKEALNYVTAINQNKAYLNIENMLSEEEKAVFKRGRNSSHLNIPKSASPSEYKNATGFEAIFGYLKLQKNEDRISELFSLAYPDLT